MTRRTRRRITLAFRRPIHGVQALRDATGAVLRHVFGERERDEPAPRHVELSGKRFGVVEQVVRQVLLGPQV